jgi:hypothetical protein
VSAKSDWKHFVETRRAELHDVYPGAAPTHRRLCPKHGIRIPQEKHLPDRWVKTPEGKRRLLKATTVRLSGICKPCRDELYEQLAVEYLAATVRQKGKAA